jgi:hypothetical protein
MGANGEELGEGRGRESVGKGGGERQGGECADERREKGMHTAPQ